jgi:3-deoxy-D-manno-octulosonic acid kinase
MTNGGQRIATAGGAMLADPSVLGNATEEILREEYWRARGMLSVVSAGRGAAWFVGPSDEPMVLRHYRRGGFIAKFSRDRYVWLGENSVRAFAEWRLLRQLVEQGLPVPVPVAAGYQRSGCVYRCDLLTRRIPDSKTLSAELKDRELGEGTWGAVGAVVKRLHNAGVDHADLNAHNILLDRHGAVSVIDFDRGRLREPGLWAARNLERLHRSLRKLNLPAGRFAPACWNWLLAGYH